MSAVVSHERSWNAGRALRAWFASPLFARQLVDFLLLWIVFRAANAYTAAYVSLPPFAFRPGAEAAWYRGWSLS